MGQTNETPPKPDDQDPKDEKDPPNEGDPPVGGPPKEDDPWGGPSDPKDNGAARHDLEYDRATGKYFDPYTGEYVVTPGQYEPPPARPLRVKVRKRHDQRLRKRRRPPKAELITPPRPPPPIYYDEYGNPLEPEYDEHGNLVDYDEDGNMIEKDELGYPIEYDQNGRPMTPEYQYDDYGNPLHYDPYRKPKEPAPQYRREDDGYDYDDDGTYTWTTWESPPPRPPTVESSDEVEEKDDSGDESMEDVDDFYWRPFVPVMPKDEARAVLKTGGDGCGCFPNRSDSQIPSMVYDQVTCPHNNNVIGHAHGSVYRFEDNWDEKYTRVRKPRRPNRHRSNVALVWGYPDKSFPQLSKGGPHFAGGLRGEFQMPPPRDPDGTASDRGINSLRPSQKGSPDSLEILQHTSANGSEIEPTARGSGSRPANQTSQIGSKVGDKPNSQANSKQGSQTNRSRQGDAMAAQNDGGAPAAAAAPRLSREKLKSQTLRKPPANDQAGRPQQTSRASIVVARFLPQIGYTPDNPFGDPSRDPTARPSGQSHAPVQEPMTLPPIPASPSSSISSMMTTSRDFHPHQEINTVRNFQGKYYDNVTNRTYTYDIKPNFGLRVDQWSARRH